MMYHLDYLLLRNPKRSINYSFYLRIYQVHKRITRRFLEENLKTFKLVHNKMNNNINKLAELELKNINQYISNNALIHNKNRFYIL